MTNMLDNASHVKTKKAISGATVVADKEDKFYGNARTISSLQDGRLYLLDTVGDTLVIYAAGMWKKVVIHYE